jgi:hypothetical protein
MNLFRLSADLTHLASIFILLNKIKSSRSCVGKLSNRRVSHLFVKHVWFLIIKQQVFHWKAKSYSVLCLWRDISTSFTNIIPSTTHAWKSCLLAPRSIQFIWWRWNSRQRMTRISIHFAWSTCFYSPLCLRLYSVTSIHLLR